MSMRTLEESLDKSLRVMEDAIQKILDHNPKATINVDTKSEPGKIIITPSCDCRECRARSTA